MIKRLLDGAWFVILTAAVLSIGAIIVVVALGAHPQADFPVAFSVRGTLTAAGTGRPAHILGSGGRLRITPPTGLVIAGLAFVGAGIALVLAVLHQLRALVDDALTGAPFGIGSASRVRLIGLAIIGGELVRAAVVLVGSLWARSHVSGPALSFRASFPINVEVVVLGILVVLLAEVFRVGAALQRDHDLTI